jgi:hypothetical protein
VRSVQDCGLARQAEAALRATWSVVQAASASRASIVINGRMTFLLS